MRAVALDSVTDLADLLAAAGVARYYLWMRLFKRLLGYMRPYLLQMVMAAVALALAGAIMAAIVATLKPLVNDVLLAAPGAPVEPDADDLGIVKQLFEQLPLEEWSAWLRDRAFIKVPLLLIAIFFVRGLLLYCGQYLTVKVGAAVIKDLRSELYDSLIFQSLGFFHVNQTGLVLSRVLNDVQRIQRVSTMVLADLVRVGAMAPCMLIVVLVYDWRMSLFALIVIPFFAYPVARLGRRLRKASQRSQESTAELANLLKETVTGIKVVQSFAMEAFEVGRFRAALGRIFQADLQAGRAMALSEPILEIVGSVAGGVLFYFAGMNIARGNLNPGDFVVVLAGLSFLFMSLRRLNRVNVEVQQALAAAKRVFDMMDCEREIKEIDGARDLASEVNEIHYDSVTFSYGSDDDKALSKIDLKIRRGEVIALVGPSGAGKTTMANLLARFHDPDYGRVLIDGNDLREVTLASLRRLIGLVTQETVIFDDTVRSNISCGRDEVPMEQVVAAARAAQAHEFIDKLPDGYDTVLGEGGSRLSMGQRQRVAVARALLKDPPILILDEATSALDTESESLVQEALNNLLKGRSSLVIAHRLSTIRQASRIVVLEAGKIVEEGSHEQLLAKGGLFARLHELQFKEDSGDQPGGTGLG
jgi:subfamily B ATP-binding cassette protein MsbA